MAVWLLPDQISQDNTTTCNNITVSLYNNGRWGRDTSMDCLNELANTPKQVSWRTIKYIYICMSVNLPLVSPPLYHVCLYIIVCVLTYICRYVYIPVHICMCVCIVCMHLCIYVGLYMHAYLCIYISMNACRHFSVSIFIFLYKYGDHTRYQR